MSLGSLKLLTEEQIFTCFQINKKQTAFTIPALIMNKKAHPLVQKQNQYWIH